VLDLGEFDAVVGQHRQVGQRVVLPAVPPMECPMRWNRWVFLFRRTSKAPETRKGIDTGERSEHVVVPQPRRVVGQYRSI
jgi:hypothetical protein